MSRLGRLLALTATVALMGEVRMVGRKEERWETDYRKHRAKYAKSKKAPLTPKQQKARAKSKRAKQARKKNRDNRSIQLKLAHQIKSVRT